MKRHPTLVRAMAVIGLAAASISLPACAGVPGQPPGATEKLKLVLTETGQVVFSDESGRPIKPTPPGLLKKLEITNEIESVETFTIIRLKKNPCYVLVCGALGCAWQKVSNGPCPQ